MAMDEEDVRDLGIVAQSSQQRYPQASHEATTGRLYHHLAIFARPYVIRHFYNYIRSVYASIPSISAYYGFPIYSHTFSKIIVAAYPTSFSLAQSRLSLSPPEGIACFIALLEQWALRRRSQNASYDSKPCIRAPSIFEERTSQSDSDDETNFGPPDEVNTSTSMGFDLRNWRLAQEIQ
ncbi:hypothetical protein VPNG_05481 [Cytospora leucostoma]|uniref:Uncharacterized protein n=1 Tax=Cytospora leucostoma TaxID=1230097 RepID=A0A423XBE0_9PEZI|nr:hypothetical protein VPNG_05481 [Cytospora leucostoma]